VARKPLLTIVATLVLAGCGSSQTTRFHSLQPQAPSMSSTAVYSGPIVQITAFNTPALFDRDALMKEVAPGQFEVQEFDHWAAPFGQMARQTFVDDLAGRLPSGAVVYPGSPVPTGAAQLAITLESYRLVDHNALLKVTWSYRDPTSAPGGWQTQLASFQTDAGDGSGAATAASINQLLGQLADQIAATLRTNYHDQS
jgi:uncharacterized lipoprotein YmbA